MNREIERKFLADGFDTTLAYDKSDIRQGYVYSAEGKVIRVRTRDNKGYITLKYRISKLSRAEFEYEIPYADAVDILDNMCEGRVLEKTRYLYNYKSHIWEIDVFKGKNKGIAVIKRAIVIGSLEVDKSTFARKLKDKTDFRFIIQ